MGHTSYQPQALNQGEGQKTIESSPKLFAGYEPEFNHLNCHGYGLNSERTGYQLEVTVGQRKYHSPPGYDGPDPNQTEGGCVSLKNELIIESTILC